MRKRLIFDILGEFRTGTGSVNYQHEFHAGNHTEVFKHALLCALLAHLRQKDAPFCVIDTHAGAGLYRLDSSEALRTNEAADGIAKVYTSEAPALQSYLDVVRSLNSQKLLKYPGSPTIIRHFLRESDRLVACETEARVFAALKKIVSYDKRIAVHHRDGLEAINAFVPPREKRGLVFIDPPYEEQREVDETSTAVTKGLAKWHSGIFAIWYPISKRNSVRQLRKELVAQAYPTLCCEFIAFADRHDALAGSGLVVCNPPWQFDENARNIGQALVPIFQAGDASFAMEWWVRPA